MTVRRFFRDIGILICFCGVFFLMTSFVGGLDGTAEEGSDFSSARKQADVSQQSRDWPTAASDYKTLAELDPFNGPAWYRCANSLSNQRNVLLSRLKEDREKSALEKEIAVLQQEIKAISAEAREAYLKSKEFARFRRSSLFMLAAIDAYDGNNDDALDFLEEFVDQGYVTDRGLQVYGFLGYGGAAYASPAAEVDPGTDRSVRLHAEPRFWEIVRKETFNH